MQGILENKVLRRNFWGIITLVLLILLLSRYFIGDTADNLYLGITASVVESLFAAFITTAFIGGFLFYMSPSSSKRNKVSILDPREISPAVESALSKATSWKFKGGYGHYFRTAILSNLSRNAIHKQISIEIIGQIIDPRDYTSCKVHAESRRNRKGDRNSKSTQKWTNDHIKNQCYSTIIVSFIKQFNNSLLNVSIFLTKQYSPRRIDMSADDIFVTWGEKYAPALQAKKGSHFYSSHDKEIHYTSIQSYKVPIQEGIQKLYDKKISLDKVDSETIKKILLALNLYDSDLINEKDLQVISEIVNKDKNPYD